MTFGHHTDRRKNGAFPCRDAACDGMMDVIDSYGVEDGIRRRRRCRKCAGRVTTHEVAQLPKRPGGRVFWRHQREAANASA